MKGRLGSAVAVAVLSAALSGAAAPRAAAPARPDPGAFVERLVVQIVRDDYARACLTLHPAHKAVARRWTYVDCELLSPIPGDIVSRRLGARREGRRLRRDRQPAADALLRAGRSPDRRRNRRELAQRGALRQLS
jgi:hypothetical protein